jgi:hypothetical protein
MLFRLLLPWPELPVELAVHNEEAVEQSSAPELGLVDREWSKICLLVVLFGLLF